MNFFKYSITANSNLSTDVWLELQNWKYYAISLYGVSNADDAIEDTYLHVLKHYSPEKGELKPYIISILTTIYKSKYKREVHDDETLQIESDKKSKIEYDNARISNEGTISIEEVEECKKILIPMYIKDFKFLQSFKSKEQTIDYSNLRELFNDNVISKALLEIKQEYDESLEELFNRSKRCFFKSYDSNKYREFFDVTLDYVCTINDIVLCKKVSKGSNCNKNMYKLDVHLLVKTVMNTFKHSLMRKVGELEVWSTVTGYISYNKEEIKERIENELLCKLLIAFGNIRIIAYEKGKVVYLASYQDLKEYITFEFLGGDIVFNLEKVVLKVV